MAGSVLPVSPNSNSNTARGLFSIGSGVDSFAQAMVFVYAQLNPSSQDPAKSRPSSASSSVASCVSPPCTRPAIWSIDTPPSRSDPSSGLDGTPVRNRVEARACGPSLSTPCIPDNTWMSSRYGWSGCRIVGKSNPIPSVVGVQWSIIIPFGAYTIPSRRVGLAAVLRTAANAGTMPSSRGSANDAPSPRSMVRRGIAFLVMIMTLPSASGTVHSARYPQ